MSRAWIAFYMGDYDKDTKALTTLEHGAYFLLLCHCWVHGTIPMEPHRRANIAKLSLRQWNKVAPAINQFFDAEGRNKRATKEIEKAEAVRLKRAVAGHLGGRASGISKAIALGNRSKREANAKQMLSKTEANHEANTQAKPKPSEANHNSKIRITTAAVVEGRPDAEGGVLKPNPFVASPWLLASLQKRTH